MILVLDTMDTNGVDNNYHATIICKIIRQVNPNAEIITYKVTDDFGSSLNNKLCEGLVYGLSKDVDIINISLGLDYMTQEVKDMIDLLVSRGTIICCASGNGHSCYPALHPNTISVGACDENNNLREYTVEGSYDVLEQDGIEINGKKWYGTSYSTAIHTGKLSKIMK